MRLPMEAILIPVVFAVAAMITWASLLPTLQGMSGGTGARRLSRSVLLAPSMCLAFGCLAYAHDVLADGDAPFLLFAISVLAAAVSLVASLMITFNVVLAGTRAPRHETNSGNRPEDR